MVGIEGAGFDLAGLGAEVTSASSRGQYAAMGALRWHMLVNGLRSRMGVFELGARTVTLLIFAAFGLGLGVIAGVAAYFLAAGEMWVFLPAVFWALCLLWQGGPVMLASLQEQFDLSILLRFPVRFSTYYLLYVVFGLADVSTILGALCCLGIWIGVTAARPELFAWAALGADRLSGLQCAAGARCLCLDRPLADPAQDAGDCGRAVHGSSAEPATAESGAAPEADSANGRSDERGAGWGCCRGSAEDQR